MSLLGVHLTLLIGPTVPIPAPLPLTEALNEVKVTQSDSGRSGFEITFTAGRGGITGVDSAAVALLLDWRRMAEQRKKKLGFRNLPANLLALAELYGVADLIQPARA